MIVHLRLFTNVAKLISDVFFFQHMNITLCKLSHFTFDWNQIPNYLQCMYGSFGYTCYYRKNAMKSRIDAEVVGQILPSFCFM